jgi:xylulokinase
LKFSGQIHLIDIGGSFIKGAVLEGDGVSRVHRSSVPEFKDAKGARREIAVDLFIDAVNEMIHSLTTEYGPGQATFFAGQMGGLVLVDRASHEVLVASSWQDQRTLDLISFGGRKEAKSYWEMFTTLTFPDAFNSSGKDIKPGSQISQLYALTLDNPSLFERKPVALTLLGYITNFFADSLMNPVVHETDAASTGLFDIYNHRWNLEVLHQLNINVELPRVTHEVCPIGTIGDAGKGVIFSAIGDQQASLLGAGLEGSRAVVNIGTGGQVAKIHNSLKTMRTNEPYQTRPFFYGEHLATVTHLPAGRLLAILVNTSIGSGVQDSYQQFFQLSLGNGKIIHLDQEKILSGEFDLSGINSGDIAKSYLSLMVSSYGLALTQLGIEDTSQIVFAGGVAKEYDAFCKELSNLTGIPYEISNSSESTIEGLGKISKNAIHQGLM